MPRTRLFVLLVISLLGLSFGSHAADGDYDTTFGNGGVVLINTTSPETLIFNDVLWQTTTGKIIAVGDSTVNSWSDGIVMRFDSTGQLDTTFGDDGSVRFPWDASCASACGVRFYDALMESDGSIVIVGRAPQPSASNFSNVVVIRLTPEGAYDATFGNGGVLQTLFEFADQAYGMGIERQNDGSYILVIAAFGVRLVRISNAGVWDQSFAGDGMAPRLATNLFSTVHVLPDNSILVSGGNSITKYTNNGEVDTSFGSNGTVSFPNESGFSNSRVVGIAQQSDGKLVAAHSYQTNSSVLLSIGRWSTAGVLDTGFGANGFNRNFIDKTISSMIVMPDDSIVLGGIGNIPPTSIHTDAYLYQISSNATPPGIFGRVYDLPGTGGLHSLVIQPNGYVVGAGWQNSNGLLMRFSFTPPPIGDCFIANVIEVCADDFTQTGTNEYIATENIRLGEYGHLNGVVTVNTADDSIVTDGVLRYRLESGQNIGLVEGEYLFDSADTADGVLTVDQSLAQDPRFTSVAEILFTSDLPDLLLDVDGDLVAQGGTLTLNSPYPAQFALNEYRIAPDGTRTGSAAPFTLDLSPSVLNADTPMFTDEGLVVSGTVGLPYLLPTAVSFSGLLVTSADLSASTQLTAGLDFSGLGEIDLGVAALSLGTAGFEVGDFRGQGTELTFTVSDAGLVLSSDLFDGVLEEFTLTVEGLRLFDDTFQFETLGASVKLPPISLYGFKLNDVEVAVELRGMTSIAFEGSGTLEVPNFIRASKSDAVGITVALKFYNDNDGIHWEQLGAGMNGLEIPLGLTPVTLTSFGGNVVIDEDEDTATLTGSAGVDISPTGFKTLVGVATLTGNVALTVNTGGWGELAGDLQLFGALQAANAAFSINKPGESVGGVRGTVVINALEILEGTLSLFIGMDAPYVEGTGTVTAVIPFSQLPTWLAVLFDVESDIPLGAVQAYLGKVGERYGIGANVTLLDEEFGLFINSSLGVSVQHGWFTVQPGGQRSPNGFSLTRHIETGVPDGFRAAGALPQSAVEVISVGVPAEADAVAFTLNTQGNPKLGVQLIDPNGANLTVASEGSYAGLQAGQKNGIITLMISDPLAGAWQMRVTGVTSTSVYQADVLGSLERPALSLGVTPQGQAWQITWDGCGGGVTSPASFDLYYDTDAANYDGAPIAADVTDCQWIWDGQDAPSGTYSLYVVGRYADDLPVMSNYSAFVTVNNAAAPATPTGLTAKADADSIVLTWFPNFEPDLAGYQVEITSSANAGWVETLTTPDNRLTLNRPDLLQTYTLRVLASDTSGNQSAYSAPVSVTPSQMDDLTPPDAPVLVGVGSSSDKLLVTWLESGAPDVAGYLIEYDFGTAGSFTACCEFQGSSPLDVGMSTSHMLTFYDGGRTLLVRVRAYDASGNRSAPSAVMSAVTPTVTPLLVNGGFETAKGAARYADKWTFKGGTNTKRVCNKVGIPGKPDKIFSFEGDCAVQLKSATGAAKAIQKLTVSGMSVGDSVRFIGNFMGKGAVKNATAKIKMVSAGGVVQTLSVVYATAGNNNTYGTASNQAVLTIAPAKITITLSYTGLKGAVLADNLRLQWIK